jgi:hypothetical protein
VTITQITKEQGTEADKTEHLQEVYSMSGMSHSEITQDSSSDKQHDIAQNTQAKLSVSQKIFPNKPVNLVIDILGNNDKTIADFDTFQEKLMHLISVSDDFQSFNHIHPSYKENGRFEIEVIFPKSGNYTLFADYKPTGQKEQVSVLKTQVEGNNFSQPSTDLSTSKIIDNTKVNLGVSQPTLKAGQKVTLTFDLKQASNNQPITDLQPYLGEKGHLVILKQSSPLTEADYIHAHAIKDSLGDKIQFMTHFSQPGKYKLWGQFNRNGKIVVADFWVNVL